MNQQNIHDQGKGWQTEVKGGTAYVGEIHINQPHRDALPAGIPKNLPRSGTIAFVGRQQALTDLHHWVQRDPIAITAIQGMGGIGKTELALQYSVEPPTYSPSNLIVKTRCTSIKELCSLPV